MADLALGGRFKILIDQRLGSGGFGVIYKGVDLQTEEFVAIKTSINKQKQDNLTEQIKVLKDLHGIKGIPRIHWDGFVEDRYFGVMDLLGEDLEEKYKQKCTVRDACIIAQQVIKTLEKIHERGYLHLDLKTRNLMVGHKNPNEIYLIDFGGACKVTGENGLHVEKHKNVHYKSFTPYYATANMLKGFTPSRRDDMLMFGYVLLDLFSLIPWNGNEGDYHLIQMRQDLSWSMCGRKFSKLPEQFYQYYDYCQKLGFSQEPDYAHLSSLFQDAFEEKGFVDGEVLTAEFKDEEGFLSKFNPGHLFCSLLDKLGI